MIHSRFRLRQCVLVLACLVAALFAGTQSIATGVVAAASADRPFPWDADSPWDILGLVGFLLGIGAMGLLWKMWKAQVGLRETIKKLDGKMKQQKTAYETSIMSRKTEIAKLDEACSKLQESSIKNQGGLESYRAVISQQSRDVEALKQYRHFVEGRLKQLDSRTQAAGAAGESDPLAADSMATQQVPNIDDCIAALNRGEKPLLRTKAAGELNITPESEDSLQRGSPGLNTRLKEVTGGGSYLLIERHGRHWLLPTVQTLSTFSVNQPQKGIFDYERESVTVPELARAAELQAVDGTWEVVRKGVVIVPA